MIAIDPTLTFRLGRKRITVSFRPGPSGTVIVNDGAGDIICADMHEAVTGAKCGGWFVVDDPAEPSVTHAAAERIARSRAA